MEIFPFMKLRLGGNGFKRNTEFRSKIKWPQRNFSIELAEFDYSAVGTANGFALGAFDGVTQHATRPKEKRHGVEIPAELLLTEFRNLFCECMQTQQLLDVKGLC